MRSHRKTTPIAAVLALALTALSPSVADANPLLSGYGGPGQGDQAIIGAALVNGPGQGGSGGGGGGGEAPAGSVSLEASPSTAPAAGSTSSHATAHRHAGGSQSRHGSAVTSQRSAPVPSSASKSALPTVADEPSADVTLGLSGSDLLYTLLAFGGLVLTAFVTRQLASRPQLEADS